MSPFEKELQRLKNVATANENSLRKSLSDIKTHLAKCNHSRTEEDRIWPQCFPATRCSICRKVLTISTDYP